MPYQIEVLIEEVQPDGVRTKTWRRMKPAQHGADVYTYRTPAEAEKVRRMCYPDHLHNTRVIEVTAGCNSTP